MAYKILERALCPDCERDMSAANVVHKKIPYTEGTALCDWCHKKKILHPVQGADRKSGQK